MPDAYSVILTTAGSAEEAESLAAGLVERKLVACAQLVPIGSIYTWEGKVEKDSEVLLLLKARADLYQRIEFHILDHHSYDTPEILQLDVKQGSPAYLAWIDSVSAPPGNA
jgi:periplasmic divalent cation tolerance protein